MRTLSLLSRCTFFSLLGGIFCSGFAFAQTDVQKLLEISCSSESSEAIARADAELEKRFPQYHVACVEKPDLVKDQAQEIHPIPKRRISVFQLNYKIRGSLAFGNARQNQGGLKLTSVASTVQSNWINDGTAVQIFTSYDPRAEKISKLPLAETLMEYSRDQLQHMQFSYLKSLLTGKTGTINPADAPGMDVANFNLPESNAAIFAAYLKIISQPDRPGLENTIASLKDQLTNAEKISLVRLVGSEGNKRYDDARADNNNTASNGSIPYENIIFNLRMNKNLLGVCRDIAPAQSQLLYQLGFKNTFILGLNNGTGHAEVISQDPDHPSQLLQISYDVLQTAKLNQGAQSLVNAEDYTSVYSIYDHTGKSVANVPSNLGVLLMEGGGGKISTLDPMLKRAQGSLGSVSLDSEHGTTSAILGYTPDGTLIVGAGHTTNLGNPEKDNFSLSSTSVIAYQRKNTTNSNGTAFVADALHVMEVLSGQIATSWQKVSEKSPVQIRGTVSTVLQTDFVRSEITRKVPFNDAFGISPSFNGEVGTEARYQSPDDQTTLQARAAIQSGLGSQSVSEGDNRQVYTNIYYLEVGGEQALTHAQGANPIKITFDAAYAVRPFSGPQILLQAGVKTNTWNISGGYQGALRPDAFTIAPGSPRAIFTDVEHRVGKSIVLTASVTQPTNFSLQDAQVQLGLKGSLSQLLKKKKKIP